MWRRMERVSWMDKITNEEILNKVREKRQLIHSFVIFFKEG